jgi:sporulation protein YlmC with PRC-barrel domain
MSKFDFKFDTEVYGRDKQCGHLTHVVVDPATQQVTNLIVESGRLFKRAASIPVSKVETTTVLATHLTINSDELSDFSEYRETVVEKGASTWQQPLPATEAQAQIPSLSSAGIPEMAIVRESVRTGVADEFLVLGGNVPVDGLEGNIGRLSHLIVDTEDFRISQLVITQGKLLPKQLVIPMHLVEIISESGIHVIATDAEANEFPEFVVDRNESQTGP